MTGSAALMMQYGIVQGNDPFLYGEKIRAYLQRGAQRLTALVGYPNEIVGYGALCVAESILWYRYQSERGNARKDLLKLWDGLEMFGVWNRWKKQKNIILLFTSQECAKINQNYRRYAKQKLLQYFYRYCLYSTHPRMWYCSGIRRLQPISWFLDFQVS